MNHFLLRLCVLLLSVSPAFAGSWDRNQSTISSDTLSLDGYQVKGNGVDKAVAVWNSVTPTGIYGAQYSSGAWSSPAPTTPNVYDANSQIVYPPVVAINALGRSAAVWSHNGSPSGQYLEGSYFNGTTWTTAGELTASGSVTFYPAVALDGSGVATAVWVEFIGGSDYLRYARSTAGGAWADANLSGPAQSASLRPPQVTVDNSGVVTAIWPYVLDVSAQTQVYGLRASRFDPNTSNPAWSTPVELISNPSSQFTKGTGLALSAAGDGSVYVVWAYGGSVQLVRYSGGNWSTPTDLGSVSSGPTLATDANSATVVWGNNNDLLVSVCAASCGASQIVPNPNPSNRPSSPYIALDATGTAAVGWVEDNTLASPVASSLLKASIRWGGTWQSTPATLFTTSANPPPALTLSGVGRGNFNAVSEGVLNSNRVLAYFQYTSVAPGTPGQPTAVAGSASATVTVVAPNTPSTGNVPTSYRVTASPSGRTCLVNGSSGSCTVTGLTNGTAYTFSSTASNPAGTSGPSQPSNSVTPGGNYPGTPGAPTASVASSTSVTITVTPPLQGAAPTSYTVTDIANNANTCTVNGASGFCTVSGLTTGSTYTFTSTATNGGGTSAASPTVTVTIHPPSTPGTPSAVAGNAQATVTVSPASGGGTPTYYTVTSSGNPAKTCTVFGPSGACTVTGLTNGTAYTFTSVASNAAGNSNPSAASAAITPAASPPGAPTNVVATAGNARVSLSWAAPTLTGGSAITGYTVSSTPASTGCTTTGTNCTVSGLTNGTAYTFTVVAANTQGSSPPSQASTAVTPTAGPLPSIIAISPSSGDQVGGTQVQIYGADLAGVTGVTFGGTPATSVSVNGSGTQVTATSPANAGGPVDVVVTTAAGSVTYSEGFAYSAPPAAPGTPLPAPGDSQVTVSWPQVFTGGGYPTSYTATAYNGNAAVRQCTTAFPGAAFPTASCTVTGLSNGTAYTFVVRATNGLQPDATSPASAPVTPLANINGSCGTANGVATMVEPTGFLCSAGVASAVTSSQGDYVWSCAGQNGGTTAQCAAAGTPSAGPTQGATTFGSDTGNSGCSLKSARMIPPPSSGPGGDTTLPFGVVNFEMTTCVGNAATVRMTFADRVEGMAFWKYVVNSYHNGWVQLPENEVTLAGNTATFTIVDNGEWDNDPTIGAIADPGGPGFAPTPPAPGNVALGGFMTGLRVASDLVLLNNGGSRLTLNQTGAFSFPGGIATGSRYNVTVGTQPPGQTCRVVNGTGVANNNVNNLEVRCVNNLYRIGGTVTGLAAGSRVRLVNNGVESLVVSANGAFTFLQGAAWNGRYNVIVGTQPTTQTCTVLGGTGFNVHNNVTNILVRCGSETIVDGQTLPRTGLIYAPCGVSVLYQNMNYYTAPGRENIARIAICALTNARLTYPDFFNDSVTRKHELIGGLEVQGYARDYLATSYYGMVTLVQKTTGQTIAYQVTRPEGGYNNSGINVDFLDGSIGFSSHLTPPLPDYPNGRWTMWITRGGDSPAGWGTVTPVQLLPDVPRDLGDVGDALNPSVNSQDIDWSAVQ